MKNATLLGKYVLMTVAAMALIEGATLPNARAADEKKKIVGNPLPQGRVSLAGFLPQGVAGADGVTDRAGVFAKAFATGARVVTVPVGTWAVSNITVPDGVTLEGEGTSSVIVPTAKAAGTLVTLNNDVTVRDLKFSGNGVKIICLRSAAVKNVNIRDVTIDNFADMAIETDKTRDMTIEHCTISRVRRATNLQFSKRVKVLNNTVDDCTEHGFQFWGLWDGGPKVVKDSADLQFIGNTVRNGGGGAIWGSGAERVLIASNLVDGAEDVGIDLEFCQDSVISGNIVRRAKNAGISLFLGCERVAITGNTILNDHEISPEDAKAAWWVRSGIWLTEIDRKTNKDDQGHFDISITGNTIYCTDGERRAIWMAAGENISLSGNTIRGGKIWQGGSQPTIEVPNGTVVVNVAPWKTFPQ